MTSGWELHDEGNRSLRTATPPRVEQPHGLGQPRLILHASAWWLGRGPEPLALQDLEQSDGIRWVDIYGGGMCAGEVLALLGPICHGELSERMVRDLIDPERFPVGKRYGDGRIGISSAFRVRHMPRQRDGVVTGGGISSVFEPVVLLVGDDWLITCWLPPRVFRGPPDLAGGAGASSNEVFLAVAERWPYGEGENAEHLANLVRGELAVACGYRPAPL